ncbi:MAG: hypothetical protein AAB221_00210 [Bacteroidota bacterium]
MYKVIFTTAVFVMLFSGCKSKSAFNFSEDIVAKEKSLAAAITSTEDKVEKYASADQYDSVAIAGAHMEELVQKKIEEIEAMSLPRAKLAAEFKAAALRYFKYIKSLYTGYKSWGKAKSDEERDAIFTTLQGIDNGKEAAVDDMQKAQKKYAEANGLKMEK